MNYQIPTQEELRTDLMIALIRMKVHSRDYWSEVELCIDEVEETGKRMPPKPRHLRLISVDPSPLSERP